MRKLKRITLAFSVLVGLSVVLSGVLSVSVVYADDIPCQGTDKRLSEGGACCPKGMVYLNDKDAGVNDKVCCPTYASNDSTSCVYAKYINPIISTLSVMAGLAVVVGLALAGVQYAASSGDPQKAAAARGKITKALVGLLTFLFLYSLLQFFSPGGITSQPAPDPSKGKTLAAQCSKDFLTLKPWFAYLPNSAFNSKTCAIENFSLLDSQNKKGGTTKQSQLILVVLAILDDLVRLAGIVAVGFVIAGGIFFVTSQGDPEKAKRARNTVFNALIGVVIAIIAASVVSYIGTTLSS